MMTINTNFSEDTPIIYTVSGMPEVNTDKWRVDDEHSSTLPTISVKKVDDAHFSVMCTEKSNVESDITANIQFYDMPIPKANKELAFKWSGQYVTPVYPAGFHLEGTRRIGNETIEYSVKFDNEDNITYPYKFEWEITKTASPEGSRAEAVGTVSPDTKKFKVVYSNINDDIDEKTRWSLNIKVVSSYNSEREPIFDKTLTIYTNIELPVITISSNPGLMSICYEAGWCEDPEKMYATECAEITDIGNVFREKGKNILKTFDEFKYFTGITEIPTEAFSYNGGSLTSITLPSTIETIGVRAFNGDFNLTNVDLSNCTNISTISSYAFFYCDRLASIDLSRNNNLKKIEKYTFMNCDMLVSVKLPESCKELENQSFRSCRMLNDINIDNVEIIGEEAFIYCCSLHFDEEHRFSNKLYNIGNAAFSECDSLELIDLSNTQVTNLPVRAFSNRNDGDYNPITVILPAGLTTMKAESLANKYVKEVYFSSEIAPALSNDTLNKIGYPFGQKGDGTYADCLIGDKIAAGVSKEINVPASGVGYDFETESEWKKVFGDGTGWIINKI